MGQKLYGNNRILCNGKFISGPDVRSSAASLLMILVPSILWHCDVGVFLTDRYSATMQILVIPLQIASMVFLLATAFSDPGIMPRQKGTQEHYDDKTKNFRQRQPPRYYDLLLRGHPFKLKYCITCNIYRPPRCTHCSVCENCIERFDHHCPWIGNCIGKRNYWLFYCFVSCTSTLNVFTLATSFVEIFVLTKDWMEQEFLGSGDALFAAVKDAPIAAILCLYSIAIVWFTVGLFLYHNYLICTNQTTYEQIKGTYMSGNNPFHRGIIGNCQEILLSKVRRRYIDASVPDGRLLWPTANISFAEAPQTKLAPAAMVASPTRVPPVVSSPARAQESSPYEREKWRDHNDDNYSYSSKDNNVGRDPEEVDSLDNNRMDDNSEAGIDGINLEPGPRQGQFPPNVESH